MSENEKEELNCTDYKAKIKNEPATMNNINSTAKTVDMFALKEALDIRKFEIELYWKRATYYWAFVATIFAGFFLLNTKGEGKNIDEMKLIVASLGFLFTFGWYLNNRGSKYWQINWEKHVELLEDQYLGSLYKTVLSYKNMKRRHIFEAYPFSVSRINQILSLYVCLVWLVILGYVGSNFLNVKEIILCDKIYRWIYVIIITGLLALFIGFLLCKGKSRIGNIYTIDKDLRCP
jgi:hypothetical protein